ncbi:MULTISPECIES: hypothetical protein [Streptomyces]|uniref:Lipoprotein n=1 Tax=Streptomyces evansiae TaxID=3075535 RepID=A0ABU2RBS8_9ACTN|nr:MULTISPECIES: hypothetical protein [unclassified Streptomyces]MDT0412755.1 hypothetical protein [Streptomyces sp. DSM 41979]SCE59047.1 hypothetical protein GA0115252_17473 [Streptomyces sp. DfronAA-171]
MPPLPAPGPLPLPPLSRRLLLASGSALAGASLLTGCSDDSDAASRRRAKAEATAAQKLSRGAARDSADLTARYDATLAAHPGLDATLRPLRAQVTRHREAFDAAGRGATGSPSPDASSSASGRAAGAAATSASPGPTVASDQKTALRDLATAEKKLADHRARVLVDAPGELARLLASVAAAGAAHAYVLGAAAK